MGSAGGADGENDAYAGFADRYDLFFGDLSAHSPDLIEFFRKIFEENGVERVLDCACGTGRHLLLFHRLGKQVVGSDVSPSMLAVARKNLSGHDIDIPLLEIDYRDLPARFGPEFDAVVCLTSALCEMPDSAELLRAVKSMHGVLREGGLLVLSQGTTDKQWREKPRFILIDDTPQFTRLFVADYLEQGVRYNVVDILRNGENSELKAWGVDYPHILLRDGQEALLKSAGFRKVEFYGSYAFEPYSKQHSNHLITIATK